ncbi:MAG: hypothetical protein ABEN55_07350, partial [Bradymonadaceae bacterium]
MQKVEPGPRERIAEHWVEAGELDRAVELLLDECKLLQERNADEEIRRILERRTELLRELDVPDDDPRWAQQKLQRAHVFEDRGHLERARGMLEDLWQQLDDERRRLRGKVAENLTGVEVGLGRTDPARMWCSRALEICKHIDDPELETSCRQRVGWLLVFDGDFDAAERQADRAIETAQQCGHRYLELEGLRLRATIWKHRGVSGTEALYDRIRREASADGYVAIEAEASNGLGQQALFDGRLEQARAYFEGEETDQGLANYMDSRLYPQGPGVVASGERGNREIESRQRRTLRRAFRGRETPAPRGRGLVRGDRGRGTLGAAQTPLASRARDRGRRSVPGRFAVGADGGWLAGLVARRQRAPVADRED